ncbi:hypothetical protein ABIB57_001099 [Devosia sp. UYZn731]|uniref:hypothetical protein n=1 Tax=Devosia sp. UYZn731 TaxID=3156345 RepID=UPI003392DE1F
MSEVAPRRRIDIAQLPGQYPTHRHKPEFWEALGRAVATFGFLEETLGRAIFAITGGREAPEEEVEVALREWLKTVEQGISVPLVQRIEVYGKHLRQHPGRTIQNPEDLIASLKEAAVLRNVICHGSWHSPDARGRSVPFFFNKSIEKFEIPIDVAYLKQLQRHVAELACEVIDTVTMMGFQFPGAADRQIGVEQGHGIGGDEDGSAGIGQDRHP